MLALLTACSRGSSPSNLAPRFVVGVSAGPESTVLTATFPSERDIRFRDARCVATTLRRGAEPPALEAGRVELWVVAGPVLGHADRRPDGRYQAQVRAVVTPGTRLAGEIAGGTAVPGHRWRTPAVMPGPIRREAPSDGFTMRAGAPLTVRWSGGSSSHVALSLTLSRGAPEDADEALLVNCVVPRVTGSFTLPAAATGASLAPAGADTATLVMTACDRAQEGEHALDASPFARPEDLVRGSVGR